MYLYIEFYSTKILHIPVTHYTSKYYTYTSYTYTSSTCISSTFLLYLVRLAVVPFSYHDQFSFDVTVVPAALSHTLTFECKPVTENNKYIYSKL